MRFPERGRKRVFVLIGLLGLAYIGVTLANLDQRVGDMTADWVKLGLVVILAGVGFVSSREYFRFAHTGPTYLAALICFVLFHAAGLAEDFVGALSAPFWQSLEVVLMIGCVCLFLVGNHLSVSGVDAVRKQLESNLQDLQGREHRYRALFEGANDAIFILKDDRFIQCNSKTLAMFGCSEDQIIGATPCDFSPRIQPGGKDSKQESLRRLALAAEGKAQCFEWRHLRGDQTPFDAEISLNVLEFSDGPCVQAIVRDVTQRREAEEEHARVTAILEATSDFVLTVTPDGRLTYLNDAGRRMLGWADDEDIGAHRIADIHPDWALKIVEQTAIPAAIDDGTWSGETAILGLDGQEIPVSQVIMSHCSADGRLEYLSTIIRDLRAQKRSEQALRENEEKYRSLVDSSLVGIGISRGDQIVFANQSLLQMYGYDDFEAFASRSLLDYLTPESRSAVVDWRQRKARGESMSSVLEHDIVRTDGAIRTLQLSLSSITLSGCDYIQAAFVDITEQKQAEEALRDSTARLQSVFDSSPLAITVTDLAGQITDCSRATLATYGFAAKQDILGVSSLSFIAERDRDGARATMMRLREIGLIRDVECTLVRSDGTEFPGELSASLMRDPNGKPLGFVGISADITERKNAERDRLDYQNRLRSLASELSLAEERERRRIAAGLHDHACQTLILSRMKLEGLLESLPCGRTEEMTRICNSLDGAVESVRGLMFDLSSPTLYRFGLEAALEELLEDKLAVEGVQCSFHNDGVAKPLGEDVRILLFQSVRELLINIIKHAHADEVTLSVERLDETVRITLTDDGVGFDVETVLSASSRSRGFGLFNLRERLAHIGGSLEMDSQPGRGSRFTLVAPLERSRSGQGAGREGC